MVRIHKFNSFKAFTEVENSIYNNKTKKQDDLLAEIKGNTQIRTIDRKYLFYKDKDGNIKENERYQISVFEGDIIRLALSDRGEIKADYQLLDEIIYMEIFHHDIMWQIIKDGIKINDCDYIFYSATTGQVRNRTITLLKKDFFEKHKGALLVGLTTDYINKHGGMNVGKYISYTALPLSSSVLPEKEINIDQCIVVKGLETVITDKVKYVDIQKNNSGQYYVADTPQNYVEQSIKIEHTDGAGLFLPGELPSSCQIRSGYFKGAIFPFDFRRFADEVAGNTVVIDAWGDKIDIKEQDIRFIFTTSQLKMWKMYDSWEAYKKEFNKHDIKISINSYANPAKETVLLAYQYLQTLPFGCDITKLCAPAKEELIRLHKDFNYVKESLGYSQESEKESIGNIQSNSSNSLIAEALNIYPQLIYDSYIKKKIEKMIQSKRKKYRAGKIPISGYYSYAAPDLYAFCEYLFCGIDNPKGLIPKNHVYNKYYDEKETVKHLICLRSPHLSRYEYGKRDLVKSEQCKIWFQHMQYDTIVSCHDLLSKTLQMDWDGDEILISDDAELYNLTRELPDVPLYYNMQQADPQEITKEAKYSTLVKGFDNNVIGDSSNAITKLWNTPEATKENPLPCDDAINVFCAYSNYAIDYPKTGKNLELGEYKNLYDKLVPPKSGKERFTKTEIKHPNFFIEAKRKKSKKVEKPTQNVMDRIKKYIGQGTGRLEYTYFDNIEQNKFDYHVLMNNEINDIQKPKYNVDRYDCKYQKLYIVLKSRKASKKRICAIIDKKERIRNMDTEEISERFQIFHYHCIREIKEIFTNSKGWFNVYLAVNYLVDLEYAQHEFATSSKDILWKCFGHILLENLQRNRNDKVVLKFKPRMAYLKAQKGDEELDRKIQNRMKNRSVDITKSDMDFIESSVQRYKNGKAYSNDEELLYVLYCLYKEAQQNKKLKDDYFVITKRKHVIRLDAQKNKAAFNMKRIMEIAGAKSYNNSLKRFAMSEGIEIIDDSEKECFKIKIEIPCIEGEYLFTVGNIYNAMVYLEAFRNHKSLNKCEICGKDFIKTSNNQKTCGEKCKNELHKLNQARLNENRRRGNIDKEEVI